MNEDFSRFIIMSAYGESLSLAHHLTMEGKEVVFAFVDDLRDVMEKKEEDRDTKKLRMSQHDGMINKVSQDKLFSMMEKIENKDEWFCLFDFNTLYPFADRARKMGFKNGLFPTRLDYMLEADRDAAKRFVLKNYPMLKIPEMQEFKSREDGIEFISESEEFWALKGNDAACSTVVPRSKSLQNAKDALIEVLQTKGEDYERKGFILERQIRDGIEVCPQMIYYNGKRVASSADFENKAFSGMDDATMYGCALNVIMETPMDCLLNQAAFPEAADKLAKAHTGLFYLDANLIIKDGDFYFLEYCSGRMGYDAVFAESEMSGGVAEYFNALAVGESPYQQKFGFGTRGFVQKREDDGAIQADISFRIPEETKSHVWLFGVKQDGGRISNVGGSYGDSIEGIDLCSFTEASNDPEYAKIKLMKVLGDCSFNGLYARTDFECLSGHIQNIEKFTASPVSG